MIKSFADKHTEAPWNGEIPKQFFALAKVAFRKLDMLNAALVITDLLIPPGNRLEILKGDRLGQHSIRVNDQWRVCFVWTEGGVENVEIVDYH